MTSKAKIAPTPRRKPEHYTEEEARRVDESQASADAVAAEAQATGVEAKIYRSHPRLAGGEAFVDEIDGGLFSEQYCKENYGGGKYRVELYGFRTKGANARPSRGLLRTLVFIVDLALPPKNSAANGAGESAAPPAAGDQLNAAVQGSVMQLMKSYQEMGMLQTAMLERMITATRPGGDVDWAKTLAAIGTVATPIIVAMIEKRSDPLALAKEVAKMQRDNAPAEGRTPLQALQDALATVRAVDELRGDRPAGDGSGAEQPAWWVPLLEVGRDLVTAYAKNNNGDRGEVDRLSETQPAAGELAPERPEHLRIVPTNDPPPESTDVITQMLRKFGPALVQWARQGRDPHWAAESLLYEIEPGLHPWARESLGDPAVISRLIVAAPALGPFTSWLEEVRAAVVEQLDEAAGVNVATPAGGTDDDG